MEVYRNEKISKEKLRYGRLKDTFDKINYKVSDDLIDKLYDDYITVSPMFDTLFDGTHKIFEYVLKVANVTKNESIMIGDGWEADIMGAKNFGIQPIYCNFENQLVGPSIICINHLLELKNHL